MPYKHSLRLLLAALLLSSSALAQRAAKQGAAPDTERLRAHVAYLASEKLEGRRTGTPGAEAAADYVAAEFKRLGLRRVAAAPRAPGGGAIRSRRHGEYFHAFPYVAGVELGKGNALTINATGDGGEGAPLAFAVGEDWMPLGFGANARVENAPAVFVGYGITAAEQNYDDYKDAGAGGKVAVAAAGTPDGDNPHGRFTRAGEVRFKAAAARAAGAAALVIIAGEEDFRNERLARLAYDNSGGDAGLPVVVVSRPAAARAFGPSSLSPERRGVAPGAALTLSTEVVRKSAPAYNVVGVLEGSDPRLRDEYVVVGAHYDHLGRGGQGSLAARGGEIHHGADDNASGTAALLELARVLTAGRERMRRSVVLVAFGGEEEGLLGSNFYVNNPPVPLEKTVAMVNLDMVGRLRGANLNVGGVGTAAEWRALIEQANGGLKVGPTSGGGEAAGGPAGVGGRAPAATPDGQAVNVQTGTAGGGHGAGANGGAAAGGGNAARFNLRLSEDGFGPSDHASFYAKRVPVLFFFTGTHEDYHKPSDTADRVNHEGLAAVASFVGDIIAGVQANEARPTFTLARVEATARSTGFRVYLGTIPVYGDSADGLKLDGVREGSPAEKSGLRAGDVIVRLAGRDVRNVYDYTQALSEMKAGQEYEVEVTRGGLRQTFRITPAARR